jgi:BNR repeat-like domain
MSEIAVLGTGLIYRNPKPHVHAIHAYFPSVVQLANGELLCSLVLGEAFDAANCHTYLARSTDQGQTWHLEGRMYPGTTDPLTSDAVRLTALPPSLPAARKGASGGRPAEVAPESESQLAGLPDGGAVAFMVRSNRTDHPEEGLANPENLGFVPTETLLLWSEDSGHTWGPPGTLDPPLVGPSFELCCPIVPLRDGRWFLPTSTWRGWDGDCPNGMKMVVLISHDGGRSWPEYRDVMRDPEQRVIYWESKICELPDGRLLAVAWAYDQVAGADLPNQYAISADGGNSWSAPRSTGLQGQTLTPYILDDARKDRAGSGRVLSVYRRLDRPGLWANLSRLEGDRWVNDSEAAIWGATAQGLTGDSSNMVQNFQVLRFGAPCVVRLNDGTIFMAFWCYEDCVSVIRWYKLWVG